MHDQPAMRTMGRPHSRHANRINAEGVCSNTLAHHVKSCKIHTRETEFCCDQNGEAAKHELILLLEVCQWHEALAIPAFAVAFACTAV